MLTRVMAKCMLQCHQISLIFLSIQTFVSVYAGDH
jgi:hypothetical protein